MANPLEDPAEVAAEPVMKVATTETKKRGLKARKVKSGRPQSARPNDAAATASKAEEIATPTTRTGRKIYSENERAHKLGQIEKSIGRGGTLKAAVKEVGITEQTYYHWKKAAAGPAEGDGLKDLVALEEENKRLKGLLAAQLRKENAELKKRLGL
ncbi:transcriptional regulator [Mesorhizobium sp. M3A.F.Ca.ET.080.04.2.1]|nr:transcriptional regulator [Mesorhizobium sp. M3A.F.Ca.ET.080.04.2.1]RWF22997.1 MAG: transcriptional regulator [Mesorhizobium sp.]